MKCYLHIGTQKTATTTIQQFLNINRRALARNGLAFTKSAGLTNNRKLAIAAFDKNRRDNLSNRLTAQSGESLESIQKNIIRSLKDEIAIIQKSKLDRIVFSSEHIHSRLTTTAEVSNLKSILEELGCTSFKVIVYLRNPADAAASAYSTEIKAGAIINDPRPPNHPNYQNLCNHKESLLRYLDVFGQKNIQPRIFERAHFPNGSILEDFAYCLDEQENFHEYQQPKNENESLSPLAVEVLRRLNRYIPAYIDHLPNPQRRNLVEFVSNFLNAGKFTLPEELRQQYDKAFSASNDWVREQFFPHLPTLFQATAIPHQPCSATAEELDQLTALIAHLWSLKDSATGNPGAERRPRAANP